MRGACRAPGLALLCAAVVAMAVPAAADYKQAVAYYNQGRFDRAIQELKSDLDQNPDWEFGHRLVGLCYLRLNNNALAISSLTRAIQLKSPALSAYLGLGQAYFNMQRHESALQALNQGEPFLAKEKETERYKFLHLRGSTYYQLQRFNEAANDLVNAIKITGGDWTDYSQLGIVYFNLNRYDEAIPALTRAVTMKASHSVSMEFLSRAYSKKAAATLKARQYDQALELLRKAREYNARDGFIYYNMAEAYLFKTDLAEAEKALNQALEIMPRSAEVYQRLGLVLEKQHRWDASLSAYQKANELNPSPGLKEAIDRVNANKKR